MGRERQIVSVSLDKSIVETLKKMRVTGLNISRLVENAIRQYLATSTNMISPLPAVDPNKVVVIERDMYFNNVCRELLKVYDQNEVRRLRIGTEYANALSLMYSICNRAFTVVRD